MTVYIEKPAVSLREELASLRNQGGYEEQQFYFDGLVTNGTFDTDTNWTKGTGWTIGGGVASCDGSQVSSSAIAQTVAISDLFQVSLDVTRSAGSVQVRAYINGAWAYGPNYTASGSYLTTFDGSAGVTKIQVLASSSFVGSIDNISVYEVDANDDVVHRMPKGWVPKDVYEDGLLQREGSAHDYEVVYDGFDYYVKPAVAPSATTQTCVIGVRK